LTDKKDEYYKDLLMDLIPFPNLSTYFKDNKYSMSINTKIYIVLMLTQGLRYLKQYKIVHLDLKPSNIMTHRNLALKIIDFGEAYHPMLKNSTSLII